MTVASLLADHHDMAELLAALEREIAVFEAAGSPDYDVIVGIADYFLEYPDKVHHPKEDAGLAVLQVEHPAEAARIGGLGGQHRRLHDAAVRFRERVGWMLDGADLSREEIAVAARCFIAAQRRHMQEEERTFFPLAERLISAQRWLEIESPAGEERFAQARERLLSWGRGDG